MGPEDSEVILILMNASRRGSMIFEIFSTKARKRNVFTELQAKCHGMSARDRGWRRRKKRSHKGACKIIMTRATFCSTEACEGIARRMFKVFGGQRSRESQCERIGGTSLVSNRIKDQQSAHCEASKK